MNKELTNKRKVSVSENRKVWKGYAATSPHTAALKL
jgi:hypothetical protein